MSEMHVRVLGDRLDTWVAFIRTGASPEVRVRFTDRRPPSRYRCDICGVSPSATCPHARAAVAAVELDTDDWRPP